MSLELPFNTDPRLDELQASLDVELSKCREEVERERASGLEADPEDFNKRGRLYALSAEIAPDARNQDWENLFDWMNPKEGERSIDVAAGTGMLSTRLAKITKSRVYAVDPSAITGKILDSRKGDLDILTITDSLSNDTAIESMRSDIGKIDIITSYGGIHHILDQHKMGNVVDEQKAMFRNASQMLKCGGRFVAGDVGVNTALSEHFEHSVKDHCLTSHHEKWLSKERLEGELIEGTDLQPIRIEEVDIKWLFDSERQMAMFMKGMHAYDMTNEEVLNDLKRYLGYQKQGDKYALNWPMLFFHLEKK